MSNKKPKPEPGPSTTHCNYCGEKIMSEVDGAEQRIKLMNGDDYVWHRECYNEAVASAIIPIYKEKGDQTRPT